MARNAAARSIAPPRIAAAGRRLVGRRERFEAARIADLLQRREKRHRQALGARQAVAQVVERQAAAALGERLVQRATQHQPSFPAFAIRLASLARPHQIDQPLELDQLRGTAPARHRRFQHIRNVGQSPFDRAGPHIVSSRDG